MRMKNNQLKKNNKKTDKLYNLHTYYVNYVLLDDRVCWNINGFVTPTCIDILM